MKSARVVGRTVLGVLGLGFVLCGAAPAQGNLLIDIGRGPVVVHVPPSYDPANPAPLVMLLHGYQESGPSEEQYMQFTPLSDQYGFIYTYPNGTFDPVNNRFWNATDACCNFFGSGVDDSTYLTDLIAEIQNQLAIDTRRIYSVGHSNGGFMSYRLACDYPDTFAAIASLAGATFFNPADCTPASPVHVLQIHGTLDTTIFYNGGLILGVPYPGAVATAKQWAGHGGCSLTGVPGPSMNLAASVPGAETTVTRYLSGCQAGGSAELWTMVGAGHTPALSSEFGVRVIEFLLAHPKPDPGQSYCTAKTNSCGSLPSISSNGLPSATSTGGFVVRANNAKGAKLGLLLYTNLGKRTPPVPFAQGGLLCIAGVNRGPVVPSGGTAGACDGVFALDVNAFASGSAGGNPKPYLSLPGTQIDCQWWGRDTFVHGAFLSDAFGFLVGP